jgi:MYXO-CTERM domain-containing protein
MNALGDPPPASGNWTPMSQTLDVAATLPALTDPARPRYVILITDGWQWCYPYDASTRFDPVTSVANLKTLGVTTYVVGFGDAVDALVLNQAAVAAGTAIAGCDPTGDTPSAANPCYQRAESSAELLGALDAIALHIAAESCDGLDNDCDGVVDEEITRECATACGAGVESCAMGAWVGCTAQTPAAEACDGLDNDCDGTVDPGCSCVEGQTRTCGDGEGACAPGQQTCGTEGTWGACEGATDPAAELCNGVDDDCDGIVDEMDGTPLCPEGGSCHDGTCVPPTPAAEDGGDESGCGCRAGGRPNGLGGALLAAVVGLAFVRRRRR